MIVLNVREKGSAEGFNINTKLLCPALCQLTSRPRTDAVDAMGLETREWIRRVGPRQPCSDLPFPPLDSATSLKLTPHSLKTKHSSNIMAEKYSDRVLSIAKDNPVLTGLLATVVAGVAWYSQRNPG